MRHGLLGLSQHPPPSLDLRIQDATLATLTALANARPRSLHSRSPSIMLIAVSRLELTSGQLSARLLDSRIPVA